MTPSVGHGGSLPGLKGQLLAVTQKMIKTPD